MLESTQVKHMSGAQLLSRLLDLPANIRLGWKGLQGTRTLANYEHLYIRATKIITLGLSKLDRPAFNTTELSYTIQRNV